VAIGVYCPGSLAAGKERAMAEDEFERKMAAIEAIYGGMVQAAQLIKGTKLQLDDLLAGQVAIWCGESDGERAEVFCEKLVTMVRQDRAEKIKGDHRLLKLFKEPWSESCH
jgi:hypothetical protein